VSSREQQLTSHDKRLLLRQLIREERRAAVQRPVLEGQPVAMQSPSRRLGAKVRLAVLVAGNAPKALVVPRNIPPDELLRHVLGKLGLKKMPANKGLVTADGGGWRGLSMPALQSMPDGTIISLGAISEPLESKEQVQSKEELQYVQQPERNDELVHKEQCEREEDAKNTSNQVAKSIPAIDLTQTRQHSLVREEISDMVSQLEAQDEISQRLHADISILRSTKQFQTMLHARQRLPIWDIRDEILLAVEQSQVVCIAGETGCGKSTQVPQFLLDNMLDQVKGARCNIVCTQPRRISAIGLCERVAQERLVEYVVES
jgi:ABC-type glutathione transport system ATPase component